MSSSRWKRLKLNTLSSLFFQVSAIVSGFILPRLIIQRYGSSVNGLVNSITQFLHIITFLELGVGAVVQSSLYKPLAEHDDVQTSKIVSSAGRFFTKIAIILLAYVGILCCFYPLIVNKEFGHLFSATLIIAISISSFAQYYFGVVDRLLLSADQRGYIHYSAQAITLILNTVACAILIKLGASIHVVKLATSCIFLVRPILLRVYVNRHYSIDRKIKYSEEPIKQKWNGIAQHVASVVLEQTDVIVLTLFSSLSNVSIYSVYNLVVYGVKNLFVSMINGIQSLMGEYLARNETDKLKDLFDWTEWVLHTGTTFVFGCTGVLVVPFVLVYTKGVTDADYIVPIFATLITIAHAAHCLRIPYNILILAAGHYKQTQHNYLIAAAMNIIISAITVKIWGLVGVAIGTLCAMLYQTVWMARYDTKNILNISLKGFYKHLLVDLVTALFGIMITNNIPMISINYAAWIMKSIITVFIWAVIIIILNCMFYREKMKLLIKRLCNHKK